MKKMLRLLPLLCAAMLAAPAIAQAQNLRIGRDDKSFIAPTIPQDHREKCLETARLVLEKYRDVATLLDPETKEISSRSINRFKDLFSSGAEVIRDYYQYPPPALVYADGYGEEAYTTALREDGVKFLLADPVLIRFDLGTPGYYHLKIRVSKFALNYLEGEQKRLRRSENGIYRSLRFTISIPRDNVSKGNIFRIEGQEVVQPEDYTKIFALALNAGFPLSSMTTTEHWDSEYAPRGATLGISPKPTFGAQVYFQTNRLSREKATNRPLSLYVGLSVQRFAWDVSLGNYSFKEFKDENYNPGMIGSGANTITYTAMRSADSIYATQRENLTVIEIPIGVSYRLIKKENFNLFVNVGGHFGSRLSGGGNFELERGTYHLRKTYNPPSGTTDVNYESQDNQSTAGNYAEWQKRVFQYGVYGSQDKGLTERKTKVEGAAYFGLHFGATAYWDVSSKPIFGILAGISGSMPLSSQLVSNRIDYDVLKNPEREGSREQGNEVKNYYEGDLENSLLNSYAQSVRFMPLTFRVGFYHRILSKL